MDRELYEKQMQRLADNPEYLEKAQEWIESMIDRKLDDDFIGALQNGAVLCEVLQVIDERLCARYVAEPRFIMDEKANIELYLAACKQLGLSGADLFLVPDLLKRRSPIEVLQNIYALGGVVQQKYSEKNKGEVFGTVKSNLPPDCSQFGRKEGAQIPHRHQSKANPRQAAPRGGAG